MLTAAMTTPFACWTMIAPIDLARPGPRRYTSALVGR